MLEKIKLYLGITDTAQDALLNVIIDIAKDNAIAYCGLTTYDVALDNTIIAMVVEDYNRLCDEGLTAKSVSGVSVNYIDGYSAKIISALKTHRKIKVVG